MESSEHLPEQPRNQKEPAEKTSDTSNDLKKLKNSQPLSIISGTPLNSTEQSSAELSNSEEGSYVIESLEYDDYKSLSENAQKLHDLLVTGIPNNAEYWQHLASVEGIDVEAGLREIEQFSDNINKSNSAWIQFKRRKL